MNIAFDIDGVLMDIEKFQLEYGSKFFQKKYKQGIVCEDGYGIKEIFNCTSLDEIEFWILNTFRYMNTVKPRDKAIETLQKLHDEGHRIIIVSSRAMASKNNPLGIFMRRMVIYWLKQNHIIYDDIVFCSVKKSAEEKLDVCKQKKVKVIVEDSKTNIEKISSVIPSLCFSTKNNKDYIKENVYRVNNFDDVYTKIHELDENNKDFHLLTSDERIKLDKQDQINYYKQMRDYYLHLPYDEVLAEKRSENCLRVLKWLHPIFNTMYHPCHLNFNTLSHYHGVIFASNHLHAFDPLLLISNGIVDFRLLAKAELLHQQVGKLFQYIGAIFVDNQNPLSKDASKQELIKTLLHGYNVMMFPEGTRNKTEKDLLDFKYGTVSIAQITGVPIIPCAINCDYRIINNNLCVNIGDPIYVSMDQSLTDANQKLKQNIHHLLLEIQKNEGVSKIKVK